MTESFPLLKLPLIALEPIIEQLDFLDLVQISMKSSKFKGILQLLKLSVRTLDVSITERSYGISITQNCNLSYIDVCDSVPVEATSEAANIQGELVHIWKDGSNVLKVKSDSSKLAILETITKHVLSFTKVGKYFLTLRDVRTEIRSLFIWQLTTQLDQLKMFHNNGIHVPISPENLAYILDGISIKSLFLNVSCPGFKYKRPIRHRVICISRPCWIDFDQISLGPETITVHFFNQKVSHTVLNRLIKDWTEGKNPKLGVVLFTWEDNDSESLSLAREHETRPPKPVLPNRNIEQLKGLCINHRMKHWFRHQSVYYEVRLSVEEELSLSGIHLDDQN